MAPELSPLDIVRGLNVADIDAAIGLAKGELAALEALRNVAVARTGKPAGNVAGRGVSSRKPSGSRRASRSDGQPTIADRLAGLLASTGPLKISEAAGRIGVTTPSSLYRAIDDSDCLTRESGVVRLLSTPPLNGSHHSTLDSSPES